VVESRPISIDAGVGQPKRVEAFFRLCRQNVAGMDYLEELNAFLLSQLETLHSKWTGPEESR